MLVLLLWPHTTFTHTLFSFSLGQVYKARLRSTGEEVAIKVQRPNIMEKIALDMHLVREFGALTKRLVKLNSDLVGTVDAWGAGFVDELDYIQEAANGEQFSAQIKETPLKDVVFAPAIINQYTTRSVLVSSWVDGERLDRSSSEDVTVLCSIAMNTYLTMLLELGLLRKFDVKDLPMLDYFHLTMLFEICPVFKTAIRTPEIFCGHRKESFASLISAWSQG